MTKPILSPDTKLTLRPGVRPSVDPLSDRPVLLFPEGVLILNETAARIVEHCDGELTLRDVIDVLRRLYSGVRADDVTTFLGDLIEQRLLARYG